MAKGIRKRHASGACFTKDNQPTRQAVHTHSPQPGPSFVEDQPPKKSTSKLSEPVRRSSRLKNRNDNLENLGNRIVSLNQIVFMMNTIFKDHQQFSDNCESLNIKLHSEKKIGLGSDLVFSCKNCQYISNTCRTYQHATRKSHGAAINMMLASALQDTSIGVEKANVLLSSMDIPPPSRSHLQKLAVQASETTLQLNETDMAEKRQMVIKHNEEKGSSDPRQFDISFDCRYNANRMVSSYKPGQAASQSYGVAIENHTSFKYVVALAIQNKLCWTGAYLRNQGFEVQCPGGHFGCTANLAYMEPHSERQMAFDVASQMHEDNIMVRTLTTDGDTKSFLGIQDFYDQLGEAWSVTRQADPNHLGSTQIRRMRKAVWSKDMFPGCTNNQARQQALTAFAKDLKSRCSKIIIKLRQQGDGDITKCLRRLPDVCMATIECYSGNCSFCPHDSLVCSGVGGEGDWWYNSEFLPTHDIHRLQLSDNDRILLKTILEVRLSERAVYSIASDTNTQKCEAFNRGALSSLPKEINFSKTFGGRLASKTLQLNNTIQDAVQTKVTTITGQRLSKKASHYLRACSNRGEKRKHIQKSPIFKAKRRRRRAQLENAYTRRKSNTTTTTCDDGHGYSKGQLD